MLSEEFSERPLPQASSSEYLQEIAEIHSLCQAEDFLIAREEVRGWALLVPVCAGFQ